MKKIRIWLERSEPLHTQAIHTFHSTAMNKFMILNTQICCTYMLANSVAAIEKYHLIC